MGKLKTFIIGSLVGAGGMYAGLQYHLIRGEEGFLVVPRAPQQRLQDSYADVREWDAATWTAQPRLALAVTEYGRGDLITDGATSNVIGDLREKFAPKGHTLNQPPHGTSSGWEPASTTRTPPTVASPRPVEAAQSPAPSGTSRPARRGFLPLADLFGFGGPSASAEPPATRQAQGASAPVRPTGVSTRPQVEILPSPGGYESLDDPSAVQLGPAAPIPGSSNKPDRRRTNAALRWQPLTVNSF